MTWQDYEETVKYIYQVLGEKAGVVIEGHGNTCKKQGKSGVSHQIDVLTSHSDGLHTYHTGIECKYWNEKVNKNIIMKAIGVAEDCNFDKMVVVTKKGFTDDAIAFAKHNKVQLVELREHNFSIKGENITKFYMNYEIIQPELFSLNMVLAPEYIDVYKRSPISKTKSDEIIFREIGGRELSTEVLISHFLNKTVLQNNGHEMVSGSTIFSNKCEIVSIKTNETIPVEGVNFQGYNRVFTKLDKDYFANQIWLLMKVLFEDKNYFVTREGEVAAVNGGEPLAINTGRKFRIKLMPIVKKILDSKFEDASFITRENKAM